MVQKPKAMRMFNTRTSQMDGLEVLRRYSKETDLPSVETDAWA